MSLLERYARTVRDSQGLQHQSALEGLRNYIKTTPDKELIDTIETITEEPLLRTLWEAGLKEPVRSAVLARSEELQRRRGLR